MDEELATIVNKAYEDKNNNGFPDDAFLNLDPTPHNAADDYLYVRYPDGLYILAAYAEDVNRDPTHAHLSLDINRNREMDEDEWQQARTVVIDNFIPYLKEAKITQGMDFFLWEGKNVKYHARWEPEIENSAVERLKLN